MDTILPGTELNMINAAIFVLHNSTLLCHMRFPGATFYFSTRARFKSETLRLITDPNWRSHCKIYYLTSYKYIYYNLFRMYSL